MENNQPLHRVTPLIRSENLSAVLKHDILLKLDCLQPSGSFKIRGIGHTCQEAVKNGAKRFISSSGGNAGNAAAYAGQQLGLEVRVIVPSSTSEQVQTRIRTLYGATVEVHGDAWDEADQYARQLVAADPHAAYIHPFDQETTWTGHATMIAEIKEQLNGVKPGAILVSVGGGGLLLGCLKGLDELGWQDVPLVAMETHGADALAQSVRADKLVTLPAITSLAKTLGAKTVAKAVFKRAQAEPKRIRCHAVSDKQCIQALRKFIGMHIQHQWVVTATSRPNRRVDQERLLVEPSCAAALSPLYDDGEIFKTVGLDLNSLDGPVVAIVCGGSGISMSALKAWEAEVGL